MFLTVYLTDGPHTVRGLAAELNVSKPAITRALDRLGELDLARRKVDPMDRRSVIVQRTLKGTAFLRDMRQIMSEAEAHLRDMPATEASPGEYRAGPRDASSRLIQATPSGGSDGSRLHAVAGKDRRKGAILPAARFLPAASVAGGEIHQVQHWLPSPGTPDVLHHLRRGAAGMVMLAACGVSTTRG